MFLREKGEWKERGRRKRGRERERDREKYLGRRGKKKTVKEEAGEGMKVEKVEKRGKGGRRFDKENYVTIILVTSKNVESP